MNHAVTRADVCLNDVRIVDLDVLTHDRNLQVRTLNGFCHLAIHFHDIGGGNFARDDVIGQDFGQLGFVGQQRVQIGLGNLGEGRVVRGKNREWTASCERFVQTRRLERRDERAEIGIACGDICDGLCCTNDEPPRMRSPPLRTGTRNVLKPGVRLVLEVVLHLTGR